MTNRRGAALALAALLPLGALPLGTLSSAGAAAVDAADDPAREAVVEGRAVCLRDEAPAPPGECAYGDPFAIESPDGTLHRLNPDDPRVEILTDDRVTRHPLRVTLWNEDGLGNILHLHTIQDGEEIEPFYFCFTCNITAHMPGPCWCCQQEFEFHERPAEPRQ